MFGERLKKLRKAKGWTQQDLADHAGVSKVSVVCWENGKSEPLGDSISKLSEALGVSGNYLMGIDDPDYVVATSDDKLKLIEQIMASDSATVKKLQRYLEFVIREEET